MLTLGKKSAHHNNQGRPRLPVRKHIKALKQGLNVDMVPHAGVYVSCAINSVPPVPRYVSPASLTSRVSRSTRFRPLPDTEVSSLVPDPLLTIGSVPSLGPPGATRFRSLADTETSASVTDPLLTSGSVTCPGPVIPRELHNPMRVLCNPELSLLPGNELVRISPLELHNPTRVLRNIKPSLLPSNELTQISLSSSPRELYNPVRVTRNTRPSLLLGNEPAQSSLSPSNTLAQCAEQWKRCNPN